MKLAKPALDLGLYTTRPEALRAFWEEEIGLSFNHLLPIAPGHDQHRLDLPGGSVLKINAVTDLPEAAPGGYRELIIAREGLEAPRSLSDPDGNRVTLAPVGHLGVRQIGVVMGVRDVASAEAFYGGALKGLAEDGGFRFGESLVRLAADQRAATDAAIKAAGYRYLTLQVFKVDAEHAAVLAAGGVEGIAPLTLGQTARISMVRDPDGNWTELSQRASIVGSLD